MDITYGECKLDACGNLSFRLPYLAVFICLAGKAFIEINFEKYSLRKYDLLILSADSFALFSEVSKDFRLVGIRIKKELASEVAYKLPNWLFAFLWKSPVCRPRKDEYELLQAWLKLTKRILSQDNLYKRPLIINHLQNLFLYMAGQIESIRVDMSVEHLYSRREKLCWKFWDLIGKHCNRNRDVAFYAQKLCITPFYLSQITRRFMNDSLKDLIERQVILEIKALLETSDMSVKEIAEKMNFDDASYMCRFFKRHTGVSFTTYRNQISRSK